MAVQSKFWIMSPFILLIVVTSYLHAAASLCGRFTFPSLRDDVITVPENETISLRFLLDRDDCDGNPDNLKITVAKRSKQSSIVGDFCQFLHEDGKCSGSTNMHGCKCGGRTGEYEFTKIVTRTDNTTWLWSTNENSTERKEINFIVTYPARFSDLKISTQHSGGLSNVLDEGSEVDIRCRWENGNPPVEARLVGRSRTFNTSDRSGLISSRFQVGCGDVGPVRCEAPGASRNLTTTLLVKCKPEFTSDNLRVQVQAGQNVDLDLAVRSHTTTWDRCRATRRFSLQSDDGNIEGQETRKLPCSLTGTPPDLQLSVRMENVKKKEEGQWRLRLSNDAGDGFFDFTLHVTEVETTTSLFPIHERGGNVNGIASTTPAQSADSGINAAVIAGSIIASLIVVVLIVIAVILLKKKKAPEKPDPRNKYMYPFGGAERVMMRPIASLAITDPRYNMVASPDCHVIRDLVTEEVDFISGNNDFCFRGALPAHSEADDELDDYVQSSSVRASDAPDRRSSRFYFNNRFVNAGRNFIDRVKRRSTISEVE